MSRHILTRDGAVVYDYTDVATPPPATQPGTPATPTPPPVAPTIPPNHPVDHDFGEGGGEYWPHDGRVFAPGQVITVAFTVLPGGNPQLDVFPGTGNWPSSGKITDYFPYMTDGETRGLPLGNNKVGRGTENEAGIPLHIYQNPGRYYYAFSVDKSMSHHIQYRP